MTRIRRRHFLAVCLLLAIFSSLAPARSCGPFRSEVKFTYSLHPDFPLGIYAAGNLGIVNEAYARSYLVVAYRYLNGKPLSVPEQKSVLNLWHFRLGQNDDELERSATEWEHEQQSIMGEDAQKSDTLTEYAGGATYYDYQNCPADAFRFASRNLRVLSTKYGGTSKEVKDWTRAQNEVFCNCSQGYHDKEVIPSELPKTAAPDLRKYRAYQIASADFYAGNYDSAIEKFNAIGKDLNSPFKDLAPYLAVRATIRKATLGKEPSTKPLQQAAIRLVQIMKTTRSAMVKSASELTSTYLKLRLNPRTLLVELGTSISAVQGENIGQQIYYYTSAFDTVTGEAEYYDTTGTAEDQIKEFKKISPPLRTVDLTDWISTMRGSGKDTVEQAYKRWSVTRKPHWLVAALTHIESNDPRTGALLLESQKIQKSSPAYLSVSYSVARILIAKGKVVEARALLDSIMKLTDLSPSTRNEFVGLRLQVCKDFAEVAKFALQSPAGVTSEWKDVPDDLSKVINAGQYPTLRAVYAPMAVEFFNNEVPLKLLRTLSDDARLPSALKADVLQAVWVRAILLNNALVASSVAPALIKAAPATRIGVDAWLRSKSPPLRRFTAVYTLLKNPGMRPSITDGYGRVQPIDKIDDYQDNFWPAGTYEDKYEDYLENEKKQRAESPGEDLSGCLTSAEKEEGIKENRTLERIGAAPDYLCLAVLAAARDLPNDPRIAEALHLAVKSTRFGLKTDKTSELSKECYQVLHRKYARSGWAEKTKFWY